MSITASHLRPFRNHGAMYGIIKAVANLLCLQHGGMSLPVENNQPHCTVSLAASDCWIAVDTLTSQPNGQDLQSNCDPDKLIK